MATKPRRRSESGFYHVYQRGVNHFDIFEDDEDRNLFLQRLHRYAVEYKCEVHAWCLMTNHVHFLIRAELAALSAMMRTLGSVYVRYFNRRHQRSGPLFEGRFCSVCVENEPQLLSAVRYVHRNPIHHRKTNRWKNYPWSSYEEYANGSPTICKLDFVLEAFGNIVDLVRFHDQERDDERHLDIDTQGPMNDEDARRYANIALKKARFDIDSSRIGTLPRSQRDAAISQIKQKVGCPLRQIQRITGIGYSIIRRAIEYAHLTRGEKGEGTGGAPNYPSRPIPAFSARSPQIAI